MPRLTLSERLAFALLILLAVITVGTAIASYIAQRGMP